MTNPPTSTSHPARVALTGGIGSGKSTALIMFHARGAAVLDSDKLVHSLIDDDRVRDEIAASLGIERLPSGEEGRRRLAHVVFSDEMQLDRLESILFPLVAAEIERWLSRDEVARSPLAVIELPMLFEAKLEKTFDYIVLITAPEEIRKLRHEGRVGLADFEQRASRQLPESEKRERSDFVYENTRSPEELDEFVAGTVTAIANRSSSRLQ